MPRTAQQAALLSLLAIAASSSGGTGHSPAPPPTRVMASRRGATAAPPPPLGPDCVYVRDHGARGDGVHDDTDAIQAAVNASAHSLREATIFNYPRGSSNRVQEDDTGPAVCFGPGDYRITRTIELSPNFGYGPAGAPDVRGYGTPNVWLNSTTQDIFTVASQHWWRFSGMSLVGGRHQLHIGNNNSDQAIILVSECMFSESAGAAVHLLAPSDTVKPHGGNGLGPQRPGPPGCEGWPQGCAWRGSFSTQFTLRDSKFILCVSTRQPS